MTIEYNPGDRLILDFEHVTGVGTETDDDHDITGATYCKFTGSVHNAKIHCPRPSASPEAYPLPTFAPYGIGANDPNEPVIQLLNLMAWCVSAAAIIGFIISGTNLALQLRRGVSGEAGEYTRALSIVAGACLVAAGAGPVVQILGIT
ncbi:hypothetical protein ACFQ1L_33605 [Phytohabitans flavus]|nr:hypothetical protein [Phytohabitans flavus]